MYGFLVKKKGQYLYKFIPTDTISLLQASKMTYIARNRTILIPDFCILNAFQ